MRASKPGIAFVQPKLSIASTSKQYAQTEGNLSDNANSMVKN